MVIDAQRVKRFWEAQAQKLASLPSESVTNLEENPDLVKMKIEHENNIVFSHLNLSPNMRVLDLGAGVGVWSKKLAPHVKEVCAVEYCDALVEEGRKSVKKEGFENIEFVLCPSQTFTSEMPFDLVFISGLLIYLNDQDLEQLLQNLKMYTKKGSVVLLRDGTGTPLRHIIDNSYSQALGQYYSALYRTREEYISALAKVGFNLVRDQNMFPEGHPLNKFPETRLRVYSFVRSSD